tara:strand:- start:3766 stop:4632 length:867 start_codon:yes stop_codon:yes gene_type:complete
MVPMQDSSGNLNGIDLSSIPTNSTILGYINNTDDKARWYPLPEMENVTNERGDPITEEFPSGNVYKVRNGTKTFTGQMIKQGAEYAGQIESFGCEDMGAYIIDASGNVIGDKSTTGYLYPIRINTQTWDVRTQDTGDQSIARILLTFQWNNAVQDSDIGMLLASDFASDVDWLEYNGLIDLTGEVTTAPASSGGNTTFTIEIQTIFGSVLNPKVITGLDTDPSTGDLDLYNETTSSAIVPSDISENTAGNYTFTFADQTTSDELSVRIDSSTNGYDDTLLRAVSITAP